MLRAEIVKMTVAAVLGRRWRVSRALQSQGFRLVDVKGKGTVGARESQGEGGVAGKVGTDCPGSGVSLGFRKEGAVKKSQAWLSDMSKTRRVLSKPGRFLAYVVFRSRRACVSEYGSQGSVPRRGGVGQMCSPALPPAL